MLLPNFEYNFFRRQHTDRLLSVIFFFYYSKWGIVTHYHRNLLICWIRVMIAFILVRFLLQLMSIIKFRGTLYTCYLLVRGLEFLNEISKWFYIRIDCSLSSLFQSANLKKRRKKKVLMCLRKRTNGFPFHFNSRYSILSHFLVYIEIVFRFQFTQNVSRAFYPRLLLHFPRYLSLPLFLYLSLSPSLSFAPSFYIFSSMPFFFKNKLIL